MLLPLAAFAQSVRWDPPGGQLGYNQVSQLALIFEDCEPDGAVDLPKVEGLMIGQPSQSTERSMVNFHVTSRFSLVFPVRPGRRTTLTIPTFDVKTDKGVIHVTAANYTVGDATVGNAGSGPALDDVASAKLSVAKDSFWAGEVFPVAYNLNVVRRYFHSLATNVDWPATPLVSEEWSKPDPSETLIRGERRVVSTQLTRAYAKQAGTFTVKPATQMVNLMVGTTGFGLFSQPTVEPRSLETNPLEVSIKPLPAAPADFSGAVGEFTFTSKVIPTSAAVGEPVTWTLELSGTGNWPDVPGLPQREVSNDFQVVQPKSKRTMKDGALFEGTLSEDVVLVPSRPGTYRLAPVRFTYFDTKSGTYKTIASIPATVTITGGAQPPPASTAPGAPIQFSLNPQAAPPAAAAPTPAVPPVTPENLPRDPQPKASLGFVPYKSGGLWVAMASPAISLVLLAWVVLAALRSRQNDPQRRRREARARLSAILTELRQSGSSLSARNSLLGSWQQLAAALWEIPHAAPGTPMVHAYVTLQARDAATVWATLWSEADRAQHSRDGSLPPDWLTRAEGAVQAARIPGWAPSSLFAGRNLLPFLFTLALVLLPVTAHAKLDLSASFAKSYAEGSTPEKLADWERLLRNGMLGDPNDWAIRHNLGLVYAQQDRWAEATAHWTSAFLLNARADTTRWDLALGLQRSGLAPTELVELSRGKGRYQLARLATPGEWQIALVVSGLLLAGALIVLLLQGYGRIGRRGRIIALVTALLAVPLAVLLAAAATLSLHTYGPLANPDAALVWKASILRSIPTEADTSQKTSPLSAGSIAIAEKTFLGWTKLIFPGGQSGWVRTDDLVKLYR